MTHAEAKVARFDVARIRANIGDAKQRAVARTDRKVGACRPGEFGTLADQGAHVFAADFVRVDRRVLEIGKLEGVLGRQENSGGHGSQSSSVQLLTEAPLSASKMYMVSGSKRTKTSALSIGLCPAGTSAINSCAPTRISSSASLPRYSETSMRAATAPSASLSAREMSGGRMPTGLFGLPQRCLSALPGPAGPGDRL